VRRHRLLLGVLAGLLLATGVLGVTLGRYLLQRGTTTPVPLAEIEQRYYGSTTTSAASVARAPAASATAPPTTAPGLDALPAPGVYVYDTQGGDRIDALAGDHHEYPATTTVTVTAADCGVLQRWDVLEERWESWQRCLTADGASIAEPARTNYDEFFSNGQTDARTCTGDARPLAAAPGTTWTSTCTEGAASETHAATVVGAEERTVGSRQVTTLHVTVSVTDADAEDLQTIDTWYLAGTDLVVAQTSTDHSVNPSPVGDVHYDEQYSITLASLEPVT
jgi:hypothetical protein